MQTDLFVSVLYDVRYLNPGRFDDAVGISTITSMPESESEVKFIFQSVQERLKIGHLSHLHVVRCVLTSTDRFFGGVPTI